MLTTGGGVPLNVDAAKMARMAALFADDFSSAPACGRLAQARMFGSLQKKRPLEGLAASAPGKKVAGAGSKASPGARLQKEARQDCVGNEATQAASGHCAEPADRDASPAPDGKPPPSSLPN